MKASSFAVPDPPFSSKCFTESLQVRPFSKFLIESYFWKTLIQNCFNDNFPTQRQCLTIHLGNVYSFKVNNRGTRKRCEICSKYSKYIIDVVLVTFLLIFNMSHIFSSASIVRFEQVNVSWAANIYYYLPSNQNSYLRSGQCRMGTS